MATNKITSDSLACENIKNLRKLREKCGLTQAQLGAYIGISGTLISSLETGGRICSVPIYNALARVFDWPLFSPLRGKNQEEAMPSQKDLQEEQELSQLTLPLNNEQRVFGGNVTTKLDADTDKALRAFAQAHDISIGETIKKALEFFLIAKEVFAHGD